MSETTSPKQSISSVRTGVSHFWSRTLIPTTREAPNDAETPSHILLHRGGFIRQVGAGIYDYLPLAWRTLRKISDIVRDEMDSAGASEMLMPALEPFELFEGTKRHEDYGDNLFRLVDRKGRNNALAPTHEEVITQLMIGCVSSYKTLPLNLYQIQTKFRDEARPRAGLLRCREFIMKDAYSFHTHIEGKGGLNEAYDAMYKAYSNIFSRCGLDYSAVEAESGPIGGSASHEFMVNCASGEDTILKCPATGYAANVEKCEIGERPRGTFQEPATGELTEVHTPNLPGIEEVGKFMKVKPDRMLKTIVFTPKGDAAGRPTWIVAVVRGDHEVNEGKVKSLAGGPVELANIDEAKKAGFAVGYVSPRVVNTVPGVLLLIDADASHGGFWASGADKPDHHVKHFNWRRELGAVLDDASRVKVGDVRNAMAGDPSPRAAGSTLITAKGIEVGHIFKLGTKYSDAMGLQLLDPQDNARKSVIMGCYGIGVSRTMAACVEMSHDADGIIWPAAIAPYHVLIVLMKPDDQRQRDAAGKLACQLVGRGVDVLIDDRDERPGVKFKDADLVGIPVRITVGDKALDAGGVEFKLRKDTQSKGEVISLDTIIDRCLTALQA
ncbi:MAG TPA: proline--tRNA ligase [Phycisphaerales bacterium]|nr:proline--tRNA ligase [Phycisphaerales bacterium]